VDRDGVGDEVREPKVRVVERQLTVGQSSARSSFGLSSQGSFDREASAA